MSITRAERATIMMECQQLIHKVTNLTDDQNWEKLVHCYTEDGVLYRPSAPKDAIKGRNNLLAAFQSRPPRTTAHMVGNIEMDIISTTEVHSLSKVWLVPAPSTDNYPIEFSGKLLIGTFRDRLIYNEGKWQIKQRKGSIEIKCSFQSQE